MTLARLLESLDDVDEALHGFYVEGDDGKFRLDVDDNAPLSKALDAKKAKLAQVQEELDAFRARFADVDLDEVAEMREELKSLREAREADDAGLDNQKLEELVAKRIESIRSQLEARVRELEKENGKISSELTQSKEQQRINSLKGSLRKALGAAGVESDALEDAIVLALCEFNGVDEEGAPVALSEGGEPRLSAKRGGNYSVAEWLETRKFLLPAKPGSGAPGTSGRVNGSPTAKKRSEMTNQERADFIKEHGGDKYLELPA